ncbi:MgtC/SapB family protein [Sphingomonas sp. IC-11]|uniref:MgtC/SapB family protein n=1 Tax=Sphingomonas sp. IC-11 TaxID=2898528 RepID=UPI001E5F2918|nr:MgtC/SapB family protein [Sphingomonas sp. IC-11]MCD2317593.1 MgtC/SapB family protein [Sphingomonas sp. IC-11]
MTDETVGVRGSLPMMEAGTFGPVHVSWLDALMRMGAALLFAFALGLERFLREKPIDFRPFVIISLSSCTLVLGISELAYRADESLFSIDPAKVVSGIMTGIGFIGAGALFREEHTVYGAGSAASLWGAGAIGIVSGFGFLWLSGLLTMGLLALLVLSRPFTDQYTIRIEEKPPDKE